VQIRKVMLVDDEPDILTVGELALQDVGGWEVCLAESGAEALELFEQERPDVVLLDVMMPRMDGPTTFQRLRDKNLDGRAVVIFMTAKVQTYEVQRYLELGAAGVIAKPFDPVSLPEEIREIVRTRSA
jgi:CheY-like chemotaxis protein